MSAMVAEEDAAHGREARSKVTPSEEGEAPLDGGGSVTGRAQSGRGGRRTRQQVYVSACSKRGMRTCRDALWSVAWSRRGRKIRTGGGDLGGRSRPWNDRPRDGRLSPSPPRPADLCYQVVHQSGTCQYVTQSTGPPLGVHPSESEEMGLVRLGGWLDPSPAGAGLVVALPPRPEPWNPRHSLPWLYTQPTASLGKNASR